MGEQGASVQWDAEGGEQQPKAVWLRCSAAGGLRSATSLKSTMPEGYATKILRVELTIRWRRRTKASKSFEHHHYDFIRCQKHQYASVTIIWYLHGADPKGESDTTIFSWLKKTEKLLRNF